MEAYMYLQDMRTAPYNEKQDIPSLEDVETDYAVLGSVSGYDGTKAGKISNEPTKEYASDYPEGQKIESPFYGSVQVQGGNIVLQDVLGRYYTFTNVDSNLKTGDTVKIGESL